MPPHKEKTKKPELTSQLLREEGILFFPKVHQSKDLPELVRSIPEHLLRFRGKVPNKPPKGFAQELDLFRACEEHASTSIENWDVLPPTRDTATAQIDSSRFGVTVFTEKLKAEAKICEGIRNASLNLRQQNVAESKWVDLLSGDIFKTFRQIHDQPSPYQETHEGWELHRDLLWNEDLRKQSSKRTGPKPDFTYAFPIIDTTKTPSLLSCSDSQVQSFSLRVLKALVSQAPLHLISAPTTQLRKCADVRAHSLCSDHLICFPWAVVEVKKFGDGLKSKKFCYCQAANASAAALALREQLARKSHAGEKAHNALVIVAITCVGPNVKLWLTYRNQDSKKVEMRCIWASSLELTWGVLVLRMIVKNMRQWVYTIVKPELARWIHVLYQNIHLPTIIAPDGALVRQRPRASSYEPPRRDKKQPAPPTPSPMTPDRTRCKPPMASSLSSPGLLGSSTRSRQGKCTPALAPTPTYPHRRRRTSRRDSLQGTFVVPDADGDWYEHRSRSDEGYESEYSHHSSSGDEDTDTESVVEDEDESENDSSGSSAEESTDGEEDQEEDEEEEEECFVDGERFALRMPKARTRRKTMVDKIFQRSGLMVQRETSNGRRRSSRF